MSAVAGTFSDFRLVKTRSCCQLVIELPVEEADAALAALGGLPMPGKERWVALAPLREEPKPKAPPEEAAEPARPFHVLSPTQQAGIKCADPDFRRWLDRRYARSWGFEGTPRNEADAVVLVRRHCGVESRAELNTNQKAARTWGLMLGEYESDRLGRK